MNSFFQKNHRLLFYSAWLFLALVQAAFTELIADEAYYWIYSKYLDWGYFDHPPMIALLIKFGYVIFHSEIGVRLLSVILNLFTLLITEKLLVKKNPLICYTIVLGTGVLQIAGFLAVPDTPLLFFTALFFYCYQTYVENISVRNSILLAFSVALLFYTKYHGLLIILFTLLSHLRLLRHWQTWLAGILILVFYSPHLAWQWNHDWVSFRYHLFESNVSAYRFSNTTDYLLGQLLLSGPLTGFVLLPACILYKPKNKTESALKFTLIGIYFVFFLSSFRGKVEANWPMPILIPLIVLGHQYIIEKENWFRILRYLTILSLIMIIAGRIYLVADIGPDNAVKRRFHNNKAWAKELTVKTGNTPVVFYNSYQHASLFWFYSGVPSHSHNAYYERRNNFNFWPTENDLLGKEVYIADVYNLDNFADSVSTKKGLVGLKKDNRYSALGKIKIIPDRHTVIAEELKIFSLDIDVSAPKRYTDFLNSYPDLNTELLAGIFHGKDLIMEIKTGVTAQQLIKLEKPITLSFDLNNIPSGKTYELRFGIKSKDYPPTHNGEKILLVGF